MKDAAQNGLDVNVWTVNEPEHLVMASRMKVNALITNYPDRALQIAQTYI